MVYNYWITRDYFTRQIRVNFVDSSFQNLDAFLAMARESELRKAVKVLREDPNCSYSVYPGEYLKLAAVSGWVEAEINFFGDSASVRLPAEIFTKVTGEYLEEVDKMYRELGIR